MNAKMYQLSNDLIIPSNYIQQLFQYHNKLQHTQLHDFLQFQYSKHQSSLNSAINFSQVVTLKQLFNQFQSASVPIVGQRPNSSSYFDSNFILSYITELIITSVDAMLKYCYSVPVQCTGKVYWKCFRNLSFLQINTLLSKKPFSLRVSQQHKTSYIQQHNYNREFSHTAWYVTVVILCQLLFPAQVPDDIL